jgi:hypothetical protein
MLDEYSFSHMVKISIRDICQLYLKVGIYVKIVPIEGPIMCGIILCMDENGGESSFE